jgi:hypothetical protein
LASQPSIPSDNTEDLNEKGYTSIINRKKIMDADDPRFKKLLETIKNAKNSSEGSDIFKTKDEDTYSDVDYDNYPDYYWDQTEEDSS